MEWFIGLFLNVISRVNNACSCLSRRSHGPGMVTQTFNISTLEAGAGESEFEFETGPDYTVSSRTGRATQRKPVSKEKKKKETNKSHRTW